MYSNLLIAAFLTLPLAAQAAEEKQMTPQQARMASCNKDATAKNLAGEERK